MVAKYPTGCGSLTFTPAFTSTGDLDQEGATREAWYTDVYGLVIHTSVISNAAPAWSVSHLRSGYAVGYANTWAEALTLAESLGSCGSWNRDRPELEADRAFCADASRVLSRHGAARYFRHAPSVWG